MSGITNKSIRTYRTVDTTGWTGAVTTVTYNVPANEVPDVKKLNWQLHDNANNEKIVLADIDFPSASQVRVSVDIALAAGTYTLVGVGPQ